VPRTQAISGERSSRCPHPGRTVLGGHNRVISRSTKNPGGALKLIDFLVSRTEVKRDAIRV
jgi:spermidine/putrescine-binding protein